MSKHLPTVFSKLALVLSFAFSAYRASGAEEFTNYSLTMTFSNTIWTVQGGPSTISNSPFIGNALKLKTDGDGKISGSGWIWVDYSNAPYSAFLVDVTGRIASTPAQPAPVVTLSFHGNGYTLNGQGGSTPNSIQLRFTGHPGPNPVNTSQTGIVGKLTGTMSGRTPFGEKSAIINLDTVIEDVVSTPLKIQAQVEQSSKRMLLFNADFSGNGAGNPVFDLTGSGQVNQSADTYRFMAHGIGLQKGWNLTVTGTLADRPSNVFPGTQFSAPATAQVTGKVQGQVVSGSTTDIQAELISGN